MFNSYQTLEIASNFTIEVGAKTSQVLLSDEERHLVEELWLAEQTKRGPLFDGQLFNVVCVKKDKIEGHFVSFKLYLAQKRHVNLRKKLSMQTLSVSGLTLAGQHVLIGQRASHLVNSPNLYETVPSGGIGAEGIGDRREINWRHQLLKELAEETRMPMSWVASVQFQQLVWDQENCLFEICALIKLDLAILDIALQPNDEYQQLFWLPYGAITTFIETHDSQCVPLSILLLSKLV